MASIYDEIEDVNVQQIITDIKKWQSELDPGPHNDIVYATLDTVIDLVFDNCTFTHYN